MFDYTQVSARVFEKIAKEYLQSQYPDFKWEITPPSGDGNKDILCKYKVLNQEFEYWAEAKFTKGAKPHTLLKGQLDPTLVSALLSPKHVTICFISNNQITETYLYRLKDFKIKTNIGIELVLKDEFEDWLINNPEILKKYNIKAVSYSNIQNNNELHICSAIVTDINNCQQYKIENYLVENNVYYLYVIIESTTVQNVQLSINSEFSFPMRSKLLDNPKNFTVKKGKHVYKFEMVPLQIGDIAIKLSLIKDIYILSNYVIPNVKIAQNTDMLLAYMKQERVLQEIPSFINESNSHNFLISIIGNGSTGKTRLIKSLHEELTVNNNVFMCSFCGNEYLDIKNLIQILLFTNIGNIFDYDAETLLSQVNLINDNIQKIYYSRLIEGFFDSYGSCFKYLYAKSLEEDFCYLYPSNTRIRQIVIIDDLHKAQKEIVNVLNKFILQFLFHQNNQFIIFASREYYENFSIDRLSISNEWSKSYILDGLSKADKLNTINYYLNFRGDINFNRATDDLIIFSNILQNSLQQTDDSFHAKLVRSFENPQIVNTFHYKEQLNQLKSYHDIIECVYYINFGIEYSYLIGYFPYEKVDYLLNRKILKRVQNRIYPYHDYYVKAYFEEHRISPDTIDIIKRIYASLENNDAKHLYLSLLVQSGYNVYYQIEKEAHDLERYFFDTTDYYKAYILAKALKQYINFDEKLSFQEIYDLFILAVSSGYFTKPEEVRKQFSDVIKFSRSINQNPSVRGLILRAQSEIINIDYWELNLKDIYENIEDVLKDFPVVTQESQQDLICAYLNILNRKMVVQLLFEEYDIADKIFEENISIINKLDKKEYIGYLYMDYAKGIYNYNLDKALDYMKKAQTIFKDTGTEHRRLLDCNCEVEYLKCLNDKDTDLSELEYAAEALNISKFVELYSKAKLKLAALKMARGRYSAEEVWQEIYLSEYVLDYPFTGRLALLYKMVKNAFFIYTGKTNELIKLSADEHKKISRMGNDYKLICKHNQSGMKTKISFFSNDFSNHIYFLDTRIW